MAKKPLIRIFSKSLVVDSPKPDCICIQISRLRRIQMDDFFNKYNSMTEDHNKESLPVTLSRKTNFRGRSG